MPHLTLEYSDNLIPHITMETLLPELQNTFASFETISLAETIGRAMPYSYYVVGENGRHGALIHLSILMYQGRPQALRTQIGEAMLAFLTAKLAHLPSQLIVSISVEIREMERSDYFRK